MRRATIGVQGVFRALEDSVDGAGGRRGVATFQVSCGEPSHPSKAKKLKENQFVGICGAGLEKD